MNKWLNYEFESSTTLTEEFKKFSSDFKRKFKKKIDSDFELVKWSRGHFEMSGFLKHRESGKFIYFSVPDVRFWQNEWYTNILIRTAKHEKDFTGGRNNYTNFEEINNHALRLVERD